MASTICLRRGDLSAWESSSKPIIAGEACVVYMPNGSIRLKIGDGVRTNFSDLPWFLTEEKSVVMTVTAADIANKSIEIPEDCDVALSISVMLQNVVQVQGSDWDIQENAYPTPDKIVWDGLGIEALIQVGDKLTITYHKK